MAWNHKGFDIELQGSRFVTRIDGKITGGDSLKALKKIIDKHLNAKAQAGEIKLPVAAVVRPNRSFRDEGGECVIKGVITGMSVDSLRVMGLDIPKEMIVEVMLPDSPENEALLHQFIEARAALRVADAAVEARAVDQNYGTGYGRNERTYADAVRMLKQSYADAVKAK